MQTRANDRAKRELERDVKKKGSFFAPAHNFFMMLIYSFHKFFFRGAVCTSSYGCRAQEIQWGNGQENQEQTANIL